MKKLKWIIPLLIVVSLVTGVLGCKDPEVEHQHQFTKKWEIDEYYHWKKCNCGEIDFESEHSFGDWQVIKAATEEAEGKHERKCTVCPYKATEVIEKLAHTHKFATDWTKDERNHWYASTCGHTTEVSGKAAHSFGEYVSNNDATTEADGTKTRECSVCGYKDTVTDEGSKIRVHTFAEEWTRDETHHWYAATCEHTTEVSGKAKHSFGDWTTTKAATEEAEGSRERSCTVCGYTATEAIEKLKHTHKFATDWTKDETNHWYVSTCGHEVTDGKATHTFGEWQVTKAATEEAEGSRERSCSVCGYTVTEVIEKLAHTHKFATDWTSDSSGHWHVATCEDTDETSGFAEHTFGEYVSNNDATTEADGTKTRECSVCGYKVTVTDEGSKIILRFVLVEGTTITGTESWTPSSEVFVSGRKLTIPDLIVSDHEVTRGEYKAVMGKDPSIYNANDRDGNELEGDAVLNNPVHTVCWYDALVYCNKRSIAEGLTPCYSIKDSTNPEEWGEHPTSWDDPLRDTWDVAKCDFEANGYRLPTEAEWEWLARGGENYKFAGSNTASEVAWFINNTNGTGTRPVKTKAPNGYGLYDMSGNVYEWCWDWYGSISDSTAADGVTSGSSRVYRGGSWHGDGTACLVAIRGKNLPLFHARYGFRVVRASSN